VTGEEDIDLLGILPPIAAFAFFYFLVCPVRELATYLLIKLLVCSRSEFVSFWRIAHQ
jgi:hypothetical protein